MVERNAKLRIAVSGPTGSGKSTAAREMASYPGTVAIYESVPSELLRLLDTNPNEVCFRLQKEIMGSRLTRERGCFGKSIVIRDRTVAEDFQVFASMFFSFGFITRAELKQLEIMYKTIESDIGVPDAYLLMQANEDVLRDRMRKAGAPRLVANALDDQLARYETWYASLAAPRVRIDTTRLDARSLARRCSWVVETANSAKRGELIKNDVYGISWE